MLEVTQPSAGSQPEAGQLNPTQEIASIIQRPTSTSPHSSEGSNPSQRIRRQRILDATLALASRGGYEAVQMRAVAERAEVAVGTLYRYFPSKVHLLVSALGREFERIDSRTLTTTLPGDTPQERMRTVLTMITKAMQRDPNLTEAMTRAFMFADASVSTEVAHVGALMDRILARAMANGEPTDLHLTIARVISDVWLSNLVAWLTRRASAADVQSRLMLAIDLLLTTDDSPQRAALHHSFHSVDPLDASER